jgi:hypothetical protein
MKMFKLTIHLDERGVSVVLGAILILGIGIAVGSLVYSQYVQSTVHSTESGFMNDVGGTFVKLQSSVSAMGENQWSIVNLKMNPSFPFFIPTQGEVGTLSANSGAASSAFRQISIKIWNNTGSISGSTSGVVTDNDTNYLEANQAIFSEKFPNTLLWFENTVVDDTGTPTPSLDLTTSYPPDGTGSIHVSASAAKFNTSKTENAYWDRYFGYSLPSAPKITLQVWLKKVYNWVNSTGTDKAAWQIDVENIYQYTDNGTSRPYSAVPPVWTSPENAYASDSHYAADNSDNDAQQYENYWLENIIPYDATITKVEVGYTAYTSGNDNIGIACSWNNGDNWAENSFSLPTSDPGTVTWVDFTSATAWTVSKLSNALFRTLAREIKVGTDGNSTNPPSSAVPAVWTNPTGAYSSDNVYASSATNNQTQQYGNYGFDNIPAWSTITKVEVGYEAKTSGNDAIGITCSGNGGATWAPEVSSGSLPTSDNDNIVWADFTSAGLILDNLKNANFLTRVKEIKVGTDGNPTNNPSSTSGGWTNPTNAYDNGSGYASITSGTPSASQTYQGYGFSIPAGSIITNVSVGYDAWTFGQTQKSITILPNATGDENSIFGLVGAGSSWQACNTDDSDTSYVYETGSNFARDLFNLGDTTGTGAIDNVVVYIKVRGTVAGNNGAETSIKTEGTTYDGAAVNVTTSYQTSSTIYTTNPKTHAAWTWDEINSLQAGVRLARPSSGESSRATYVWVVVNYTVTQYDEQIRVDVSGNGGTSWSSKQITSLTSSETTYLDNVTALGWAPDNLNDSNFRVRVDAYTVGDPSEVRLDWIPVQVTYTAQDNVYLDYLPVRVTYTAQNNVYLDYLPVRVTYTDENSSWTPGLIYYENTGTTGMDWKGVFSSPISGKVGDIRAWLYAYAAAGTSSGSTAALDVWADDISLLAGPPFWDDLLIGSNQIVSPQYVDNVVITLGFWSKDSGTNENLYILENNYPNDNWLINSKPVPLRENAKVKADNKQYWTFTIGNVNGDNRGKYIDNNGIIWLNFLAENDNSPFRLWFDYINFQVNYLPGYEQNANIQGYFGSSGALTFNMSLYSFPNQSYIYDDGAVILVQNNTSVMASPPIPPLVDVKEIPGDDTNIEVDVNHVALTGISPPPITKTGYASVGVYLESSFFSINGQENFVPFDIKIPNYSLTANAWYNYLVDRAKYFNSENFFSSRGFTATAMDPTFDENWLYLRISNTVNSNANIFYYEHVKQVNFSIS